MDKMKTNELTGAALNWAVAKCEGVPEYLLDKPWRASELLEPYSTDWSQGGVIIEREKICVSTGTLAPWMAWVYDGLEMVGIEQGPTPLIAVMRCYVASKLGDTVEIPAELRKG